MFPDFDRILENEYRKLEDYKVVTVSDSLVPADFVVHHFLSVYVKRGYNVCLVTVAHTLRHYACIQLKLGNNFTPATGKVEIVECLKLFTGDVSLTSSESVFSFLTTGNMSGLLTTLRTMYNGLENKTVPTLLIIDDLSLFHSLGAEIGSLSNFIHGLIQMTTQWPRTTLLNLLHCDLGFSSNDMVALWRAISHVSDLLVDVRALKTGYCADVDGQITITWASKVRKPERKSFHFKLSERTVSLIPMGLSSAVL